MQVHRKTHLLLVSHQLLTWMRYSDPPESYLCVETTSSLQKERQVGLDLTAVGVGPVLGLALQCGDLVLKSMIPPAGRQKKLHEDQHD